MHHLRGQGPWKTERGYGPWSAFDIETTGAGDWQRMFSGERIRWLEFSVGAIRKVAEIAGTHGNYELRDKALAALKRRK